MRRDEVRESRVECARSKQVVALHGYVDGYLEVRFGFEIEILGGESLVSLSSA